jgi:hypothetical protein
MIIWGLDLKQIRFSAFLGKNMFQKRYHFRSQRFVWYQLAMIFTVVSECLATYCLDKYLALQNNVSAAQPGASLFNNDIVGAAGLSIFAGVYTATIFGTMFFFLLFWPALPESKLWFRIKATGAIFSVIVVLAAALTSTIIVASHSAYLIPSPTGSFEELQAQFANPNPPYKYSDYGRAIGWVVLMWIGWVFTIISTWFVFKAARFHLANPHVVGTYTQPQELHSGPKEIKESV